MNTRISSMPFFTLLTLICVAVLSFTVIMLMSQVIPNLPDAGTVSDAPPLDPPAQVPTREPRPPIYAVTNSGGTALQFYFLYAIPQGETRLARIVGGNIRSVMARWLDVLIDFYEVDGAFYGLLSSGMDQAVGAENPLDIFVAYDDGTRTTLTANVQIVEGSFVSQSVDVIPARSYLVNSVTEAEELAQLEGMTNTFSRQRLWDDTGFQLPIVNTLTSPFGAFRTMNSILNSRHTGWDIHSRIGEPVLSAAAGEVVYTGTLDIRGNYVLIDHGLGVFSAYAHLREFNVQTGQMVTKGQVLGTVGDTGRTNGAHFHWEMTVNGQWVNSVQFMEMWQP